MGRLIDVDEYEKRIKPYDTEDVMDKALYNFAHNHLVTTPSAQPEGLEDKLEDAYAHGYTAAEAKYRKWIEKFDRIIRELGVNCAYDMPSFWCNQGKDYKVIPTKYHKGYMQALADVEERMKGAEE